LIIKMRKLKTISNAKTSMIIVAIGLLMIFSISTVSIVSASGFSPSSLIFNLTLNEKSCQTITINSNSDTISVSDKWAVDKDIEWKVSLFNSSADSHSITISYPSEISLPENKVEVCLSGSKVGEYHGVMLLREEQQGNSVVQMGVWLKVTITEKQSSPPSPPAADNSGGGGSSGGGGGSGGGGIAPAKNATTSTPTATNIETLSETGTANEETGTSEEQQEQMQTSGITGAVIGTLKKPASTIIIIFIALAIAGAFIYNKNKNRNPN